VTGALAFSATNMALISRSVRRKQAEDGKYMGRVNPRRKITMLLIQICNEWRQGGKSFLHHARKVKFHAFITGVTHKDKTSSSNHGKL